MWFIYLFIYIVDVCNRVVVCFFKLAAELDFLPGREHTTQHKIDLTMNRIQIEHKSVGNKTVILTLDL